MIALEETKNYVEELLASYESRIVAVETLFQATQQVIRNFHEVVLDTKQERETLNDQLRDNLAQGGSLRKKDYDNMMRVISSHQDRQEQEIRNLSKEYLGEQTEFIHELRNNLKYFREALVKGEVQRVRQVHEMINEIVAEHDRRKNEVILVLREFQNGHHELARMLKELVSKGRELRLKDFKRMLEKFRSCRKDRIARKEERRREVIDMLGDFKSDRTRDKSNLGQVEIVLEKCN